MFVQQKWVEYSGNQVSGEMLKYLVLQKIEHLVIFPHIAFLHNVSVDLKRWLQKEDRKPEDHSQLRTCHLPPHH